ncbi:sensor domain-containing diguanylate cyclase [Modicisalibacter luteus]|uniref:Diguanylate cyclase domain-containing protein n=1 Tax=Modicisalibacter luteus TaxID=453962 RepID=A0ABV7LYR7_9GAMM|nr:diguanylate cyclase [Halomonas lutea]GHA95282.1 hypothetical protein GCM10007159_15880 [Halomonas lutea]
MDGWRSAGLQRIGRLLTLGVRSLHKRLLLGLATGWIVVVAAILLSTWNSGQRLIGEVSNEHLEYEARAIAEMIDQEVRLRFETLERLALQLPAPQVQNAALLRAELRHNDALLALFDGLMVVDRHGQVLADWPQVAGREGLDVSDTGYFAFQQQVGGPYVSEPFFGRASQAPLLMLSMPLRGRNGEFIGLVGGVVNIMQGSFFEKLRRIRIGDQGFAALMTASGKILVHPELGWILSDVPPASQNPWLDLALAGWQGNAVGTLATGQTALQAYRQVWAANWIVGVMMPLEQAFAPLQWFVRHMWLVGTLTVVVMLGLLWWLLRLALWPLTRLERQINAVGQGLRERVDLHTRSTELNRVMETFNRVVEKQRLAESELLDRQAFLDAVLASSPLSMFIYDLDGNLRYINPAMMKLTGYSLEMYRQRSFGAHIHVSDREDVRDHWKDALATGRDFQRQYRYVTAQGETIWVESHASLVRLADDRPLGFVGTLKDITHTREMEALQRWEAEHDPLTGLLNRRGFERRMEEALADWVKSGQPSALVFFDLDRFKPINDEGGHALGDDMLQRVAQAASARIRTSDNLARYGGDEFALLMPGCGWEQARNTAEALRKSIEELGIEHQGRYYQVTLSLGVTSFLPGDQDIDSLMQRADHASYRAKAEGRNRTVVDEALTSPVTLR